MGNLPNFMCKSKTLQCYSYTSLTISRVFMIFLCKLKFDPSSLYLKNARKKFRAKKYYLPVRVYCLSYEKIDPLLQRCSIWRFFHVCMSCLRSMLLLVSKWLELFYYHFIFLICVAGSGIQSYIEKISCFMYRSLLDSTNMMLLKYNYELNTVAIPIHISTKMCDSVLISVIE